MKKNTRLFVLGLTLIANLLSTMFLWAADLTLDMQKKTDEKGDIFQKSKKLKTSNTFVVQTDENMAAESLERISGDIDSGFLFSKNVFKSPDHYRTGPFSREKAEAEKNNAPDS